jgi:uncharacterized membrane protein YesL
MKTIIRAICVVATLVGLVLMFSECDQLGVFFAVKAAAFALMVAGYKGFERTLSAEEWREKA